MRRWRKNKNKDKEEFNIFRLLGDILGEIIESILD